MTIEGRYYDGRQPVALPAVLAFEEQNATLTAGQASEKYNIHQLKVSPRIGLSDRFISLPNGGQVQCADHVFLDSLPQESRSEGPVAWLEARLAVALAGVAIIVAILLSSYFYGLPIVAERVAARIPLETERAIGQQALAWLDNNKWVHPTILERENLKNIQAGFDGLVSGLPLKKYYNLKFRSSKFFGPNAFALPGGTIVITDDMVKAAKSPEEVLAVLAHEIGHVELRHTMRSLLQDSAVAVAAATITADAASLSAAVAGLPAMLAKTKYSREFERAADDYAFGLLKKHHYSPAAFADVMERLAKKNEGMETVFAYISTHPVTSERVRRARAAGTEAGANR